MTPFEMLLMQALEDSHRLLFACKRQQAAHLLDDGITPDSISTLLREIDETERDYELARLALQELAS